MGARTVIESAVENSRIHATQCHLQIIRGAYAGPCQSRQPALGFDHACDLARGVSMSLAYREASQRPPDMELLGMPMHRAGVEQVHNFIEEVISKQEKAIALNLNVYCVNLALQYRWLYEFIQSVHLVFCD